MATKHFHRRMKLVLIFLFGLKPLVVICSTPHENTQETQLCHNNNTGRTADPYNCCKFIECSDNQRKSCPLGLMFSRTLKLCDWPEKVHCEVKIRQIAGGDWINGVYTGCHVLSKINKFTDVLFKRQTNTTEALQELKSITTPQTNKTLSETVLMTSLHTLLWLVKFNSNINSHVTAGVSVTEDPIESNPRVVYEIASNLLDGGNIATWREIDSKTPPNTVISRLVKVLDDYGLQVAKKMDEVESFSTILTDNLAATIIKPNYRMKKQENESCFHLQESFVCLSSNIINNTLFSGAVNIIYYTLNDLLLLEAPAKTYTTGTRSKRSSTVRAHQPVHSVIVSSTISPSLQQMLNASIKIVLKNRYKPDPPMNKTCVFWEYENPVNTWLSRGCGVVPQESTNDVTSCLCTHLTLFAVLMDPYNIEVSRTHRRALELISTAGCSVSLVALTCTILVTSIFWKKLTSVRTKVLLNLCVALAASCVLVIIAGAVQEHEMFCKAIAVFLHFILLSVFSWMLCEGILLYYITTSVVTNHEDKIKYFCLLGWGFPAIVVMVTLAVTRVHGYGRGTPQTRTCWLTVDNGLIWVFVTPALTVILINIGFLVIIIKRTLSSRLMLSRTQPQRVCAGVKAAVVSLPLLGITWSFGLLAFNYDAVYFKYLFAIFNSLQGLMIFVLHCALNKKVQEVLIQKFARFKQRSVVTSRVKPAPT